MKGRVLDFSFQTNSGVIAAGDGSRYPFTGGDWQSSEFPEAGMPVDFDAGEHGATGIYLDTTAPVAAGGIAGRSDGAAAQDAMRTATATATEWLGIATATAIKYAAVARAEGGKYWGVGLGQLKGVPRVWLVSGAAGLGAIVVAVVAVMVLMAAGVIGGGNPQPASVMDLVPDNVEGLRILNVNKIMDDDYLSDAMELDQLVEVEILDIDPSDVSEMVMVVDGGFPGYEKLTILKGGFDLEAIRDELDDQDGEEQAYRGYEIWEDLPGGKTAALLKGYIIMSDSVRSVEAALKDLYNETGTLELASQDNGMRRLLGKLPDGYVTFAFTAGECDLRGCEGYGFSLAEYDDADEESKVEVALLFRNEGLAGDAADDYDGVAEFLENEVYIEIDDTESDGRFVVGEAYTDLW